MKWYLVFDASCSTCNSLAQAIYETAAGKLEILNIHDTKARAMLDQAYPTGWQFAPYLVAVDQTRARAYMGAHLALRLAWLMGPKKAWRIWNQARQFGVLLPPGRNASSQSSSRRLFFKTGLTAIFVAVISQFLKPVDVAFACVPCDTCGEICRFVPGCWFLPVCGYPLIYDPCQRYDCYDGRTGEYCYTYYTNCCCDCSCA